MILPICYSTKLFVSNIETNPVYEFATESNNILNEEHIKATNMCTQNKPIPTLKYLEKSDLCNIPKYLL